MPILRLLLVMFLWPGCAASAQELLLLTFAPEHTGAANSYNSSSSNTLTVLEGQKVILQQSSGRDYQLQASRNSWSWTQVQQVPRDMTYIAVTAQLQGKEARLEVDHFNREGDKATSYTGTVKGTIGEWIPLLQPSGNVQAGSGKRYSTKDKSQQLSVKVERAR